MNNKQRERLSRQFENAGPKEFGEALDGANHVLIGDPKNEEALLIKEYITSLDLPAAKIEKPKKIKVTAKKTCFVDGVQYTQGQSGEITMKQFHALSRFFEIDAETLKQMQAAGAAARSERLAKEEKERQSQAGTLKGAAMALLLGMLVLFGAMSASAQQYRVVAIAGLNGGTNVIAASTTSGTNIFGVTQEKNYTVTIAFKLMASGTSAVTLTEYHSGDGTNWDATGFTKAVTAAGTTPVAANMEFTNKVAGYYGFTIQNANTAILTNLQLLHDVAGPKGL